MYHKCFEMLKKVDRLFLLVLFGGPYLTLVTSRPQDQLRFPLAIVTDLDKKAICKDNSDLVHSVLMKGQLVIRHRLERHSKESIGIEWQDNTTLTSAVTTDEGRGMELSELIWYNNKLLALDDRTGTIFAIGKDGVEPWFTLTNGRTEDGFKTEWATVKDGLLYVGSNGRAAIKKNGRVKSRDRQWVKVISPSLDAVSLNWTSNYEKLRTATYLTTHGLKKSDKKLKDAYLVHESGVWSDVHKKWFFLPRKCSKERYDKVANYNRGCNLLLIASENFSNIQVKQVGEKILDRGYTSFKFLPGSNDEIIVALKATEVRDRTASYITAFTIDGTILMSDKKISNDKYEGLEFVDVKFM